MFLKRLLRDNLAVSDHTRTSAHTHACADVHSHGLAQLSEDSPVWFTTGL